MNGEAHPSIAGRQPPGECLGTFTTPGGPRRRGPATTGTPHAEFLRTSARVLAARAKAIHRLAARHRFGPRGGPWGCAWADPSPSTKRGGYPTFRVHDESVVVPETHRLHPATHVDRARRAITIAKTTRSRHEVPSAAHREGERACRRRGCRTPGDRRASPTGGIHEAFSRARRSPRCRADVGSAVPGGDPRPERRARETTPTVGGCTHHQRR